MNTIYWITRLDTIVLTSWILFTLAIVVVIIGLIIYIDNINYGDDDKDKKTGKFLLKLFTPIMIVTLFIGIFTPTTNQAIAIYGGGKILDYIENNEQIQQWPDKVINITDKYIDNLNNELNVEYVGNKNDK